MVTNKKIFARLMALLNAIDPQVPLHPEFESALWQDIIERPLSKGPAILEHQDSIPKHVYFIVSGFITFYFHDVNGDKRSFRICREGTIVATDHFLRQYAAPFTIEACRGAVIWSLSHICLKNIFDTRPCIKDFSWKTVSRYAAAKELMRNEILDQPAEGRVLSFYTLFKGLLNTRTITDTEIASYLLINVSTLRDIRSVLKKKGLL